MYQIPRAKTLPMILAALAGSILAAGALAFPIVGHATGAATTQHVAHREAPAQNAEWLTRASIHP